MANLDFLGDVKKEEVSTGNKTPVAPVVKQKPIEIQYDRNRANENVSFQVPLDTPYVQRAIEKVKAAGFVIAGSWKAAIKLRHDGIKAVTLHEADIILRKNSDLTDQFLLDSLLKFDAFITEEPPDLSEGVFFHRTRHNKGVKWLSSDNGDRSQEKQRAGIQRLAEIDYELACLGFPIHQEEADAAIHVEFLKPEYMTFSQFSHLSSLSEKYKTLAQREQIPMQRTLL